MHIALLTPSLNVGGYERVVVNYANELSKLGHQVTVIAGKGQGPLGSALETSVRVVVLNARARFLLVPLVRFLYGEDVDVLYSGFRVHNSLVVIARALARSRARLCASQHGFEKHSWWMSRLFGLIIRRADIIVANSPDVARHETRALALRSDSVRVLHNPVVDAQSQSIASRPNQPCAKNADEVTIGVVSRLAYNKRVEVALEIFAGVLRQREATLIIVGDGPQRGALSKLAGELGVSHRVLFTGYVSRPMDYAAECDVLLITSELEGFGNVAVESLYAEVPVVCTSCSGPPYIIQHSKYGVEIGPWNDSGTVERGVQAVLDVFEGKIPFGDMRARALEFEVGRATKDLLREIV